LIRGVTLDDARRVPRRLLGGPEMLTVIVGAVDGIPDAVIQKTAP
jgi:hypothetical protein